MRIRELTIHYTPRVGTSGARRQIRTAPEAAALLGPIAGETVEVFEVVLLDTKHRLIAVHRCARGTLDACLVHPRDVLKAALLANAAAIVTGHNHPSGDPEPSPDDLALFARLRHACDLVGVSLLDNLVVGHSAYWSEQAGRALPFTLSGENP
jgi:DNA repair protein RadC